MNNGALLNLAEASTSFARSSFDIIPLRNLIPSIRPCEASRTLGQLVSGHFETHEQDGYAGVDRRIFGDVGRKRRLAHARTRGQE